MGNEKHYTLAADVVDDYAVGPAVLLRTDSRLGACGYVHQYSPITVGGVADRSASFWDSWGDVQAAAS